MKNKFIISLIFILLTITSFAQEKNIEINSNVKYRLYPTENMWTFIKLNTRNGEMWQVQFDINGSNRFATDINFIPLIEKENEVNDRFTLYSTQNIYNFILLDQLDGRMWQAQWSLEPENRGLIRIE